MWVATLAVLAMDAPHTPTLQPSSAVDAPSSSFAKLVDAATHELTSDQPSSMLASKATTSNNVTLVSLCESPDPAYSRLCELTRANFRTYASQHGYGLHLWTSSSLTRERPQSWFKVAALCAALRAGAPWALWADADTVFMQHRVPLHAHLPHLLDASEEQRKHFILSRDISLLAHPFVNMGHALIDNSEWSHSFLETAWNVWPQPKPARWWEQAAVAFLLGGERAECRDDVQSAGCLSEGVKGRWANGTALLERPMLNALPIEYFGRKMNSHSMSEHTTIQKVRTHNGRTHARTPPWPCSL